MRKTTARIPRPVDETPSLKLPGGEVVLFLLRRSARRRLTIATRVLDDGTIVVRAPAHMTAREVLAVLAGRARWIERQRALVAQLSRRLPGWELASLPYLGEPVPVIDGLPSPDGATVERMHGATAEARLIAWYRRAAERYLPARVAELAALVGAAPTAVVVSRQRRAWGSCSPAGAVRLSWRLMMLRPHLIDFVIVHELCHLLQHNHSPKFWTEVERVLPDARLLRAELRSAERALPL